MKLEKQIGKGANNTVYKSGDMAVKVFNEGYGKADVMNEAYIAARIEEVGGINIPKLREVTMIDGKFAIAMDLVEGKTMAELIKENPNDAEKYIDQMVDIQVDMQKKTCPYLVKLKDKLMGKIKESGLDDTKIYELQTILNGTPKHNKICHGDFTPHNVMISNGKAYILDWNHATQGNASADAARTFLWLSLHHEELADMYMEKFCAKTGTDKRYVQQWLPVVAAARLTKHRADEEALLKKWTDVVQYE